MLRELWTPTGVDYKGTAPVARSQETGLLIELCTFDFKYTDQFAVEHRTKVIIPRDSSMSKAHVEDLAAQSYENFLIDCKQKYTKRPPNVKEWKEIGKALEDFRRSARKRRESTNKKIYY
tara:strand:+ start:59 stop:418 length:360 start_codon:yes stop_codon:yes gene_type:complete